VRRLAIAALCLLAMTDVAPAQPPPAEPPVLFSADEMSYDQNLGIVTARGNVEISQGERVLLADSVTYYERENKVAASGNVTLVEPTGEVLFTDYVELTDSFRNGFIRRLRMLLADNSRLNAESAERRDGNRTLASDVTFSPCNLCPTDPSRPPLWQLKAGQVIHDQQQKIIEYRDTWFELGGVPIAYTPYFRHPDPTVKRQSGLLVPSFAVDEVLGVKVEVPYYWTLGDTADLTVTPMITSKEGLQFSADYRQRLESGELALDGSVTRVEERDDFNVKTGEHEVRGHIRGDGRFRFADDFLWGFNVARASDKSYLRRYKIAGGQLNALTSRVYLENVRDRTFLGLDGYAFQNMRFDADVGSDPLALPLFDYSYASDPVFLNGRFGVDANLLSLYRPDGADNRRASLTGSWVMPYYGPLGDVYTLTAQLRGDVYWVSAGSVGGNPQGPTDSTVTGRAVPLLSLDWRYPFVGDIGPVGVIVEPIAVLVLTPRNLNLDQIPNEDSFSVEFDDTNLFSLNRFPGLDRIEEGPRLNYGLRLAAHSLAGYSELMLGQVLRLRDEASFAQGTGLFDQESDYVARLLLAPMPYLHLVDRIRFDEDSLQPRRHEIFANVGPPAFQVGAVYAALDKSLFTDELGDRKAAGVTANARLLRYWSISGSHLRDLAGDGSLRYFGGLRYTDECIDLLVFFERNFFADRDVEPSTTIGVKVRLDNLS
jgi:LPS-assembly protein